MKCYGQQIVYILTQSEERNLTTFPRTDSGAFDCVTPPHRRGQLFYHKNSNARGMEWVPLELFD